MPTPDKTHLDAPRLLVAIASQLRVDAQERRFRCGLGHEHTLVLGHLGLLVISSNLRMNMSRAPVGDWHWTSTSASSHDS